MSFRKDNQLAQDLTKHTYFWHWEHKKKEREEVPVW